MEQKEREKLALQEETVKEGDRLRDSLLNKLFTLNTILSAAFLVLFQFDKNVLFINFLNILPFISVALIIIYELIIFRAIGHAYHELEKKENHKIDLSYTKELYQFATYVILISIILTLIELGYLFYILIK